MKVCADCGAAFTPTRQRQARCPEHEDARRAGRRRRAGSGGAWETVRRQAYERDHGLCVRCGRPVALRRADATADRPHAETAHLQPFSAGGTDELSNVETVCIHCHREEHS